MHSLDGAGGVHNVDEVHKVCTVRGIRDCTQSVGMGVGTELVGSAVCAQQLGKAEDTQCSDSGARSRWVGCMHFW